MALDSLNVILLVTMSAVAGVLAYRSIFGIQLPQQQVRQAPPVVEVVTSEYPRPEPYWVNYGLPEYWPVTLSPYWYYGAPWYGPIGPIGSWGGYDRPGRGHPSHAGHSGVASGGGGHGGGGGGHGGR